MWCASNNWRECITSCVRFWPEVSPPRHTKFLDIQRSNLKLKCYTLKCNGLFLLSFYLMQHRCCKLGQSSSTYPMFKGSKLETLLNSFEQKYLSTTNDLVYLIHISKHDSLVALRTSVINRTNRWRNCSSSFNELQYLAAQNLCYINQSLVSRLITWKPVALRKQS